MDSRKHQLKILMLACMMMVGLSSCESKQERARDALDQYQAAVASGDLPATHRALLALVQIDDSNPDYWIELGKVRLQLNDAGAAYDAFVRGYELNRGNVEVLGVLTQLSLRSGNLALAEQNAKQLELLAPDNPAVRLTYGYLAFRRGNLDEAERQAKLLLAAAPFDPSGTVLQARILFERGQQEQAIALLKEQVASQPSDQDSWRTLASFYELLERWPDAAWASRNLLNWQSKNLQVRAQLIENELNAGRASAALPVTLAGVADSNATPAAIEAMLAPWLSVGGGQPVVNMVAEQASRAVGDRRWALTRFLGQAGRWDLVERLAAEQASLPVSAANLVANALLGTALSHTRAPQAGLDRLDQALALDGNNADALRGRAEVRIKLGDLKGAEVDAQKLVAVGRDKAPSWLFLAAVQASAGKQDAARRTLWDAFHQIPGERSIYQRLSEQVRKDEGEQAGKRLAEEYQDQRQDALARSFA